MKWQGRRQSTNISTAGPADYASGQTAKAMKSPNLRDPTSLDNQSLDKNSRVGQLEPTLDDDTSTGDALNGPGTDASFLKHTVKGY